MCDRQVLFVYLEPHHRLVVDRDSHGDTAAWRPGRWGGFGDGGAPRCSVGLFAGRVASFLFSPCLTFQGGQVKVEVQFSEL